MIRHCSRFIVPATLGLALAIAGEAKAALITYTFQGIADVTLDGTNYDDRAFSIVIKGATDLIFNDPSGVQILKGLAVSGTASISGVGRLGFQNPMTLHKSSLGLSIIEDDGGLIASFTDAIVGDNFFATYDLASSTDPVMLDSGSGSGRLLSTDQGGTLAFVGNIRTPTFQAQLDEIPGPVIPGPVIPEPASVVMLGIGGLGLLGFGWRRRRRSAA